MSYDKVSLLLPMNGANNGTVFTDYSPVQKTVTVVGDAKTSTAQSKYYGSSGLFDGTGDWLTTPNHSSLSLGSGDFTIGAWIRPAGYAKNEFSFFTSKVITKDQNNLREWNLGISGTASSFTSVRFQGYVDNTTNTFITASATINLNEWAYIEACRIGNLVYLSKDGVILNPGGTAFSITIQTTTSICHIGAGNFGGGSIEEYNGYIQDLRVIKGVGLHSSDFTPPARLIGTISNAAVGAGKILDAAGNPAERTVIAVPRSAPVRMWSTVSNASGEFSIDAPAGVDHSVVALADEATLYNDIVHRVIPE